MLILAALMFVALGLMHSLRGGRYLIDPILRLDGLPVILGSRHNTRLTLKAGWHIASLFWWGNAAALVWLWSDPARGAAAFLIPLGVVCLVAGATAAWLSKGKHLSWVFFLPIGAILLWAGL